MVDRHGNTSAIALCEEQESRKCSREGNLRALPGANRLIY
jgi:hypothetical protein